jgi:diaminopimelate decarboxylase
MQEKTGFYLQDEFLYCDDLRVDDLLAHGIETPFYLYSTRQLDKNFALYQQATEDLDTVIGYAIKANNNLFLCQRLARQGAGAVVVSVDELRLALKAGFPPGKIWMHGNGKRPQDLEAAIQEKILLSADSLFDLEHINAASKKHNIKARVMLRVNPDIDPGVHPYISTGIKESKFGLSTKDVEKLTPEQFSSLAICGVHCHLGSTIKDPKPFVEGSLFSLQIATQLLSKGFPVDTLDIGGGLGIDYERLGQSDIPSPKEMLSGLYQALRDSGLRILLEPGRSLVGNVGALIGRVIGIKRAEAKNFLVVDASMVQLIRPALYGAYHFITKLTPTKNKQEELFDVVGPICESSDFLAKDRLLCAPEESQGIAVLDAGAYGFAMSSRYNMHLSCAEYVVHNSKLLLTRRAERFEDFYSYFTEKVV